MRCLALCLALLVSLPAYAEETPAAVKIGVVADLSGHAVYWGKQTALGARLAEKELRASGKDVTVIVGDSAFKTTSAISEAQKMLFSDNVDAVYTEFSPIVAAVSPVVKNANRLFYGSGAGASFLNSNPASFKSFMDYRKACKEAAQIIKDKGVKNAVVLRWPFESGELCAGGVEEVYGSVNELIYNAGESLSSHALKMKGSKVDGIMFVGVEADSLNLAKALSELKYTPYVVVQADDINVAKNLEKYASILDGIITYGFVDPAEDFVQKLRATDSNFSPVGQTAAALSYLAIMQLYEAIASCPKGDLNCQMQKVSESKPWEFLGFQGYKNRVADFTYQYVSWKGAHPEVIK